MSQGISNVCMFLRIQTEHHNGRAAWLYLTGDNDNAVEGSTPSDARYLGNVTRKHSTKKEHIMEFLIMVEFAVLVVVFLAIMLENKKLFDELAESDRNLRSERESKKILRNFIQELKENADER